MCHYTKNTVFFSFFRLQHHLGLGLKRPESTDDTDELDDKTPPQSPIPSELGSESDLSLGTNSPPPPASSNNSQTSLPSPTSLNNSLNNNSTNNNNHSPLNPHHPLHALNHPFGFPNFLSGGGAPTGATIPIPMASLGLGPLPSPAHGGGGVPPSHHPLHHPHHPHGPPPPHHPSLFPSLAASLHGFTSAAAMSMHAANAAALANAAFSGKGGMFSMGNLADLHRPFMKQAAAGSPAGDRPSSPS